MSRIFNRLTGKTTAIRADGDRPPKKDEVLLSEDLVERYHRDRDQWAQNALDDHMFRNNMQLSRQMEVELARRNQSPVTFNLIHPAVELAKSMLTNNRPRFQSTAKEDSDVETGRLFSDIMSHVWHISNGTNEFEQHVDDFYVMGMGCWMAWSDPRADWGKGEVYIKELNPLRVYIDPNSTDRFARDASHIVVADLLTAEQVQEFEPFVTDILRKAEAATDDLAPVEDRAAYEGQKVSEIKNEEDETYYRVLDRYSKIKEKRFHVYENASRDEHVLTRQEFDDWKQQTAYIVVNANGQQEIVISDSGVAQMRQVFEQTGGTFHFVQIPQQQLPNGEIIGGDVEMRPGPEEGSPNAVPASTVELIETTIGEVLSDDVAIVNEILVDRIKRVMSVGGVLVTEEVLPVDQHPVVPVMNGHNRNPYPMSDVRQVRGLQEYYNKLKSDILAHLQNSKSIKAFVPRGTDREELEREFNKAGFGAVEFDADIGQPVFAQVPPLNNELYLEADRIEAKIQKIMGVYDLMAGDPSQSPATFKGTLSIDEFGQRRIKSKRETLEAGLNVLAKVVLQLVQDTYTEQKVIRIFQPNNAPKEVPINQPIYHEFSGELIGRINDVTVGKYDIVVVSGSTLPNNRWARFEYYRDLYREGVIDQVELLKQTDVADIEGVLERSSEIAQLKQQLAAYEEQIKDLQGDLQTARRESINDMKKVEVEKFKSDLKTQEARAEKETELYKQRLNDKLKNLNSNGTNNG